MALSFTSTNPDFAAEDSYLSLLSLLLLLWSWVAAAVLYCHPSLIITLLFPLLFFFSFQILYNRAHFNILLLPLCCLILCFFSRPACLFCIASLTILNVHHHEDCFLIGLKDISVFSLQILITGGGVFFRVVAKVHYSLPNGLPSMDPILLWIESHQKWFIRRTQSKSRPKMTY